MEGSSLGVWVAHGEGRAHFPRDDSLQAVLKGSQAPLRLLSDLRVSRALRLSEGSSLTEKAA